MAQRAPARGRRSSGASRSPAAKPRPRGRRGPRRRRPIGLRAGVAIAVVVLGFGGWLGARQLDFDRAIREVTLPLRHEDVIRQQAREKDLDAALIAAVIYAESRFRDQVSHAGARGLMQVTPDTADVVARLSGAETFVHDDLSDPDINIRYGAFYLRHLLERYDGNVVAALAGYNAGHVNADRWGGSEMGAESITFPETRAYVAKVLEKQGEYRDVYSRELGLR